LYSAIVQVPHTLPLLLLLVVAKASWTCKHFKHGLL